MGLLQDAALIRRLMTERGLGSRLFMARIRNRYGLPARLAMRAAMTAGEDKPAVNVMLNDIWPQWLPFARRNVMLPNHEYIGEHSVARIGEMDLVMCKTRVAEQAIGALGANVLYTGFTTPDDPYDPAIARNRNRFLHVTGTTTQKGTKPLLDLWKAHPDWPELVVVVRLPWAAPAIYAAPNITIIDREVPPGEMAVLQNQCGVHICPSEAEGYGHVLAEGLACAAVVITTDGDPMNELIRPEHGVLVPWSRSEPKALATAYFVDPDALEAAVERVLAMSDEAFAAMGRRGRRFYLSERRAFLRRFAAAWDSLV